jgi:hypothetical protein
MTDKLPEWPFPVRPDCAHLSEWKLERQMALVAYWESRARRMADTLMAIEQGRHYDTPAWRAHLTLEEIGPLPTEQP